MSDTSTLWLHHSIPKGDPHGRCTRSPHSPCLHGCMHGCMRPSVIDVFGAVTKPQLCSEHVRTCTCVGYINSKSTSDCIMYHDCVQEHVPVVSISTLNLRQIVFRVLCTHNCGEHLCKEEGIYSNVHTNVAVTLWNDQFRDATLLVIWNHVHR